MPFTHPDHEKEKRDSMDTEPSEPGGAVATASIEADAAGGDENRIAALRQRARERRLARRRLAATLLRSLTAVIIGSLILRIAAQMMGLMLQSYLTKLGVSPATMGIIIGSFFIAELSGAPVLGALSDRYGRKKFILLGPILGAVAVQITSMTTVIWILVITRLLEGLSTASAVPATLGYISEATSGRPKLRARIIGLFEITFVGGMALGAMLGGYVWKFFGAEKIIAGLHFTSPAFAINGIIYVISLIVFIWGLKNVGGPTAQIEVSEYKKWSHYREILKSPLVWRLVPAWLAINSVIGMWFNNSIRMLTDLDLGQTFKNQLLMGRWHDAPQSVYLGFGIVLIVFASGVLIWSLYLGRVRKTVAMLVATGGIAFMVPAIFLMNHHAPFLSTTFYLPVAVVLMGILVLSGFAPAALTYLADVTETYSADRGTIMGLYSVFLGVGQFIGTATGGVFLGWLGIDGVILLSLIFGAVTALSLISLHRRNALSIASA